MTEKLGIVFDPIYLKHDTGPTHPESSRRLIAVQEAIKELEFPISAIPARAATVQELALIHSPKYIEHILEMNVNELTYLDPDTVISAHSQEAALKAAGGVIEAIDKIMQGELKRAFCAVRPPGHHAERDQAMGFCIFNNIAVGAAHALLRWKLNRIAIVDWDLHHGNGTQQAFYDSDEVLYISLHEYPFYPGSGREAEKGKGKGLGYTINLPMVAGSSDDDYRSTFQEVIIPALDNYGPELIMISAGFDAHRDDPLGDLNLSTGFFGETTAILVETAKRYSGGRVISVLEGGYNLQALRDSVTIHLKELAG